MLVPLIILSAIFGVTTGSAWAQTDINAAIGEHTSPIPLLAPGQAPGEAISFESDGQTLKGVVYVPSGDGPFPAIIWNHGEANADSPSEMNSQPELAAFYNEHGFVFFHPYRRGVGPSPGEHYALSLQKHNNFFLQLRIENIDVAHATKWLMEQPFVDPDRVIMSGIGLGAAHAILLNADNTKVYPNAIAGFVPFAPLTLRLDWTTNDPVIGTIGLIIGFPTPMFLIIAANDHTTGPVDRLGPLIEAKVGPNGAKIYPEFGVTVAHGHDAFATWRIGTQVWGDDVLAFIDEAFAHTLSLR